MQITLHPPAVLVRTRKNGNPIPWESGGIYGKWGYQCPTPGVILHVNPSKYGSLRIGHRERGPAVWYCWRENVAAALHCPAWWMGLWWRRRTIHSSAINRFMLFDLINSCRIFRSSKHTGERVGLMNGMSPSNTSPVCIRGHFASLSTDRPCAVAEVGRWLIGKC